MGRGDLSKMDCTNLGLTYFLQTTPLKMKGSFTEVHCSQTQWTLEYHRKFLLFMLVKRKPKDQIITAIKFLWSLVRLHKAINL